MAGTLGVWSVASQAAEDVVNWDLNSNPWTTLDFGTTGTFLTGIRGDNIVGNYVISGGTAGLLYSQDTMVWTQFPIDASSEGNYPGALSSSPYGPSFGSQLGILRVVGSYKTTASSPVDLGYLYDGAATPGEELTTLSDPTDDTKFTIAHSNFGSYAVGNYDEHLSTGSAFIYNMSTGNYDTLNINGSGNASPISTTAYGVYGDKIAGGYADVDLGPGEDSGFEHGYIYDMSIGTYETYNHPSAAFTHFEGITGAGKAGEYNLVADWFEADGTPHSTVLHIAANGDLTWYDFDIPGSDVTSSNSAYQGQIIGVYTDADGTHGYSFEIPAIYTPFYTNVTSLVIGTDSGVAIEAMQGDDVLNTADGSIVVSGENSIAISANISSVITNEGMVSANGDGSAAVKFVGSSRVGTYGTLGTVGTLLNDGVLNAASSAFAILADGTSGTTVVNTGRIDGRVVVLNDAEARFENSGWFGVTGSGAKTDHEISGLFAQTAIGTLALRIGGGNDELHIGDAARLAGTLSPIFQQGSLARTYTLLTATELTGTFTLAPIDMPSYVTASLAYTDTSAALELEADMGSVSGLTGDQGAVGNALDMAFNTGGGIPDSLNAALFALSENQLPASLNALSGELYASEQSVLIKEALLGREALLERLRQISYSSFNVSDVDLTLNYGDAPVVASASSAPGLTIWAKGIASWGSIDGNGNSSDVSGGLGGLIVGTDIATAEDWNFGLAFGYTYSDTDSNGLSSSAQVQTGLIGGYASKDIGAVILRAGGLYSLNYVDTDRSASFPGYVDTVEADYRAGTGQLFGEVAYGAAYQGVALEPFAGLAWVHLNTQDFNESGGDAALMGSSSNSDVGYSSLGFRIATSRKVMTNKTLKLHVSLAWQYAFGDLRPEAALAFAGTTGAEFTASGAPLARNAALIDVGTNLEISPNVTVGLSYFGELAQNTHVSAGQASLTWGF
ncbi:autotransporter domain-containing protein [Pseudovibrio sp. Tun.PSC04-5.I4]|uniref:autotransporter family protein n=1 Tax=Pseudovibrio sp. Tun.PSC04-5.I4 TaxID=1798213 RepID=UPI001356387C|nr:autotransporter domain-containing protein [Pseudovibrio sp. Tun.PSC04-5.I4]